MRSCARREKSRDKAHVLPHAGKTLGAIAVAARGQRVDKGFVRGPSERELLDEGPGAKAPFEWLLGIAMAGDGGFFARKDAAKAVRAAVGRVRTSCQRARLYECHSCEPKQADALLAADGRWRKPISERG